MSRLHVVYVLLRFPALTETFIAEEFRILQSEGLDLQLYSLLKSRDRLVHPVSQHLLPQVQYAPGVLSPSLWSAQIYWCLKAPLRYVALLADVLKPPVPELGGVARRIAIFLKAAWLARRVEHSSADLIHSHFAWLSAVAALIASRLIGIPFTVTAHAYDIYSSRSDLLPLTARCASRVVTISDANRLAILSRNPDLPPAKVEVVRCGIDLDRFCPTRRPAHGSIQITSVGSLLQKKGHEFLIRACDLLRRQSVDFECIIVGSGSLHPYLHDLILSLGIADRVILAGAQPQDWVRERLRVSDLFVLACVTDRGGDRDGIPVAIMEAMAMGVPVVSTPVSGIPELVRDRETGLLVPERDPQALSQAMTRLITDHRLRRRMISNGLDLIKRQHDIRRNTRQLRDVFERAAADDWCRPGGRVQPRGS